ncbi:DUF1707 domain-containing protein [Rhodococcus sp. NPDC059234]|uniref:DUF1707 SHOCT-like domain-containing protein n=1 Tax=Rhodococcus sp. NPDC059234 TaxID=3346781 RepID=UPI0036722D31
MPTRNSPRTRARDLDRMRACGQLDAAYAEGQLGADEYHDRTARATAATTLGELRDLTSDLQLPDSVTDQPPVPTHRPRGRVRPVVAVAGAVAVAVAVTLAVIGLSGSGEDTPAAPVPAPGAIAAPEPAERPAPAGVEPIVVTAPQPLTRDGLERLLADWRAQFGDLVVHEVGLYPDYAFVERTVPGSTDTVERFAYRGGLKRTGTSPRFPTSLDVDLARANIAGLADVIGRAPALLGAPGGAISHALIDDAGRGSTIRVYATRPDDTSAGYLRAGLDGTVIDISRPN